MVLLISKKSIALMFSGLFFLSMSFGAYNLALHPNMQNWIQNKVVITRINTSEKIVTLTFDDGPDPTNTPAVLDSLKKYNAKATFFVLGSKAEAYPVLLQEIINNGHEIGNHGYSHSSLSGKSNDFIKNEIEKTNNIVYRIVAQKPVLFRPPGGFLSYELIDISKNQELSIAYWTYQQDSKDWVTGKSASLISGHIIKNIEPGQIIILHDGCLNGLQTAEAVDIILNKLTKEGYRFVTMSELIKAEKK